MSYSLVGIIDRLESFKFRRFNPGVERFPLPRSVSVRVKCHSPVRRFSKSFPNSQRVVVKASYAAPEKMKGHLEYLQRDGAGEGGERPRIFTDKVDSEDFSRVEGRAFAKRIWGERRFFKFIISPENGDKIEDLEAYTRSVMLESEKSLRRGLRWCAVVHKNTENPHVHVVVRGVAKDRRGLIIDNKFLSYGLRKICQDQATQILGERTVFDDIRRKAKVESVTSLRIMPVDEAMLLRQSEKGFFRPLNGHEKRRFKFLKAEGFVTRIARGKYKITDDALNQLKGKGVVNYKGVVKAFKQFPVDDVFSGGGRGGRLIPYNRSMDIKGARVVKGGGRGGRLIPYNRTMDIKGARVVKVGFIDILKDKPYVIVVKDGNRIFIDGVGVQGFRKGEILNQDHLRRIVSGVSVQFSKSDSGKGLL